MREIFYGAAIQGNIDRAERAPIHKHAIDIIKREGFAVLSEHTSGKTKEETALLLENAIGKISPETNRSIAIRQALLGFIDRPELAGIIFETTIPSTGTGIEIGYACTRQQRGLTAVQILALNQKNIWPSGLSTMVKGVGKEELPNFELVEYEKMGELENIIKKFLSQLLV